VIWDTDGREYIDCVCGLGAISLGYEGESCWYGAPCNREPGGVYSLPHQKEVEAAELVRAHVAPWASSVRFTKTGSEACHAAYRIAKKATGRRVVYRLAEGYHGWHEWATECEDVFDVGELPDTRYPETIAAVFIEPPRFQPVDVPWLKEVRAFCDQVGALMVIDEMIYGGRWALGGATEYYGVVPDMATYGKALANGQACAFVVGRDAVATEGEIASGTFSGCVTGLSALCETLHTYTTEPVVNTLWARAKQLHAGFSQAVPRDFCRLTGPAPLMGLQFSNPDHKVPFKDGMHAKGILTYPDWLMVMYAHTPEQIDKVVEEQHALDGHRSFGNVDCPRTHESDLTRH
jgi:glutamate-1-semialdehyde aminotransferase